MDGSPLPTTLKHSTAVDDRRYPRLSEEEKTRVLENVNQYLEVDAALRAFLSGTDGSRVPKLVQ